MWDLIGIELPSPALKGSFNYWTASYLVDRIFLFIPFKRGWDFPGTLVVKNMPSSAGDMGFDS